MNPEVTSRNTAAKPVLLTVDDDPAVLRAVERDLRKRYADRYRVLRAESGAAALDLVRERGGQTIVELGSTRSAGAQKSDGHSTLAWGELSRYMGVDKTTLVPVRWCV